MNKKRILIKEIQLYSKKDKLKDMFITDKIQEMNKYQNMINNKKKIINIKINEEEKNMENSLFKLRNRYNNITAIKLRNENKDFSEKYSKFSKTNIKTIDSLIQDLSEIYYNKGYQIPNLNNNLFKINPLLENNTKKIYLSNLSELNRFQKSKRKLFKNNKAIKYMNKLENLISPDKKEEKKKAPNLNQYKFIKKRLKFKERNKKDKKKLTDSIKSLKKLLNNNILNNIERKNSSKTRNKSEIIKKIKKNSNYFCNTNTFTDNKILQNENISTDKNKKQKSISSIRKLNNNNNKISEINKFHLTKTDNNNYELSYTNNNKTVNSSKKLGISKINGLLFNESIITNNEKNILNNKKFETINNKNFLETPKNIINKNNKKEKSNFTRNFSINNETNSLSTKSKLETSKTKDTSFFKIKDFTINSYKTKYSERINEKISVFNSSNKLKLDEILNNNKKIPLEFRILSPKKIIENNGKDKFINKIFREFNVRNIKDVEKNIKIYLSQIKRYNEKDIKEIIEKYKCQNLIQNLEELQNIINKRDIEKKTFRLYLNNHDYNRIEPVLKVLNEKEKQILKFDQTIKKISINS